MIGTLKKYIKDHVSSSRVREYGVVKAYDLWAGSYDTQPGNLMLDLDESVFSQLLASADIKNKRVADIGCGTGRHWPKLLAGNPATLTGFDVSPGMLDKLKVKFPAAEVCTITDNQFLNVDSGSFDLVVSTLTVAHIANIREALDAWSRIAADEADIIITDFHPDALAFGGKRTFKYKNTQVAVRNFVHQLQYLREILEKKGFKVVNALEKKVDESVKHYYKAQNALHVFEKFNSLPIIYGIHLRRSL